MSTTCRAVLTLVVLLQTLTSLSQRAAAQPLRAVEPQPLAPISLRAFDSDDARHEFLWRTRADYRSALTLRRTGMFFAIAGGATAMISGVAYLFSEINCGLRDLGRGIANGLAASLGGDAAADDQREDQCGISATGVIIAVSVGLSSLVGGLVAIGVGHGRVSRIREPYRVLDKDKVSLGVDVAMRDGGAVARVRLRF